MKKKCLFKYFDNRTFLKPTRVMKITGVFLIANIFSMTANDSFQANDLSIQSEKVSLKEVFKSLSKNSPYTFVYSDSQIENIKVDDPHFKGKNMKEMLNASLENTDLNFFIEDKVVVISKKQEDKLVKSVASQQKKVTIKGVIKDEQGATVPFATIKVKGTANAVVSNELGEYNLQFENTGDIVIVVSSVGFETYEVKYQGQSVLNVTLKTSVNALDELLVTGYQTLSKERASGSFGTVDKAVLESLPVVSPTQFLNGQVAGLEVKNDKISIRGVSSFVNNSALVVVDGFPISGGLNNVNPNNIESITVLKDAAAASIWGARSSNGVIVITTKKDKSKKGESFTIEANSFIRTADKIDLNYANPIANAATQLAIEGRFVDITNATSSGTYDTPTTLNYQNSSIMLTEGEYLQAMKATGYLNNGIVDARLAALKSINYQDDVNKYLLREPFIQQYNIAMRGNSKKHNYNFSMLYNDSASGYVGTSSNNITVDFNDIFRFNDRITFNAGAFLSYRSNDNSGANMSEIKGLAAYDRLINPDGTYANNTTDINFGTRNHLNNFNFPYNWNYNLLQEVRNRDLTSTNLQNRFQFGLDVKIIDGLSFNSKIQLEKGKTEQKSYFGENTYYVRNRINLASRFEGGNVSDVYYPKGDIISSQSYGDTQTLDFRNQLNFNRTFADKHRFDFIAGMEIIDNKSKSTRLPEVFGASKFMDDVATLPDMRTTLDYGIFGNTTALTSSRTPIYNSSDIRYFSAYGNLAYTYDDKLTLTGSVRTDASNIVSDNPKFRYQPLWSVGMNWNAARESFIGNMNIFNRLNARLSYGINANAAVQTSNVTTVNYYTGNIGNDNTIYTSFNHGNPDLKWEITKTLNAGLDFAVLNSKLFGSIDVYDKRGQDLYFSRTYPSTSGVDKLNVNYAGISNRGIEVTLGAKMNFAPEISMVSTGNYTYNKNKITDLINDNVTIYDQRGSSQYVLGDSYRDLYVFRYNGYENNIPYVIAQDGQTQALNTSVPNLSNAVLPLLYNAGHTIAPHLFGWTNTINIHNFSITSIITGKFGNKLLNPMIPYSRASITGNKNFNKDLINYLDNGAATDFPGLINAATITNLQQQRLYVPYLESFVDDAAFIRFNDLTFNYNASKLLSKVKFLDQVNIYNNISNIGMLWTANKWHMDPENPMGSAKPSTTYTLGIKLNIK